ncbi:MAG TPA: hypothetical protein VNZ01_03225 [Solirubrobacteraceae bacterium]|jgi:hypothetical protein|nr:hypothetical protein [Solirubrobacteraceae bacterium]
MKARALPTTLLLAAWLPAGCGNSVAPRGGALTALTPPATYADYPALRREGPSGIGLVEPSRARAAATSRTRPLWVGEQAGRRTGRLVGSAPQGAPEPDIASARELARLGRARIWIARSSSGGICVLSFRPELGPRSATYHSVSASCGSAAGLARGAVEIERAAGRSARWLVSGVAPREISAVTLRLSGGRALTVPVTDNAYSATVERPVEGLAFVAGGMGH